MKKETSVLFILPLKMFIYTIIFSFLTYGFIYKFSEENFRKEIRESAISLSTTADWALIPLLSEGQGHIDAIDRLFEKLTANSMVKRLRIYDENYKILFSNNKDEQGLSIDRDFIIPIIKEGKLIKKEEDFKNSIYEIAIPLKDRALIASGADEKKCILYVKMNFRRERIAYYRLQILIFAIIGLFTIMLLTINNVLIKYYILDPVMQMKKGLAGVAEGKYDQIIPIKKEREVNELIRVFNQMVHNIKKSNQVLNENRKSAEILVEAKGAFLSNMTHELRTPLNSVIGYSELLLEEEEDKEKNNKLKAIIESGKHLLSIINNILDFSKIDAEKLKLSEKVFDTRKTLKNIEDLFKIHSFQKGIDFKINIEKPFPDYLKGDEGRIKQILINLISNSFKFTDEGNINLNVSYKKNRLFVDVLDTGQGIKEESLSNIFNSFEQVDVHHKGTGLGLSITKALCELMNGDITVSSKVGEGTKFSLDILIPVGIPKKKDDLYNLKMLDEVFSSKSKDQNKRKFKILVAEDIEDNQLVLNMMLKKLDVDIDFADNGQIALDFLRKNKYDLFLLDIQMPVMNGLEVLAELTSTGEIDSIYVVALTAYSLNTEKTKILSAGAKGILTKPLSKDQLRGVVSYRMSQKRS
jgi:signal transduction histidine kinase/ActR/RegA family two-component response regulator